MKIVRHNTSVNLIACLKPRIVSEMDAKALAKSKRAHSLHHTRKPLRAAPSPLAPSPFLPSNQDRYEDSPEELPLDSVLPKSKGADYRHLIEEARSNLVPSLNDGFFDVFPGGIVGKMVSANTERITTWIEDDNFIVDDSSSPGHEAPLFSLNLRALSEKLKQVDISKSLFIDSNILSSSENRESDDEKEKPVQAHNWTAEYADQSRITQTHSSTIQSKLSYAETSSENENNNFASKSKDKYLNISAAEAELDKLLNSFSDTDMMGRVENKISDRMSTVEFPTSTTVTANVIHSNQFPTKIEDMGIELDALLQSITDSKKRDSPRSDISEGAGSINGSSNAAFSGGKIDEMPSGLLDTFRVRKMKSDSSVQDAFSASLSKSKILDEFDSWMDSL